MFESCYFWDKIGHAKSTIFQFEKVRVELLSDISSQEHFEFSELFFILFSKEIVIIFWLTRSLIQLTRSVLDQTVTSIGSLAS